MSQFNSTQPVRTSSGIDVYTGLLCAALLVLAAGVFLLAQANIEHSGVSDGQGGVLTLVDDSARRR